jgi:hypothetical protein
MIFPMSAPKRLNFVPDPIFGRHFGHLSDADVITDTQQRTTSGVCWSSLRFETNSVFLPEQFLSTFWYHFRKPFWSDILIPPTGADPGLG